MSPRSPFAGVGVLLVCIAFTACGATPEANHVAEQDGEIAALQQKLSELTSQLNETRAVLDRLFAPAVPITDSPPPLAGTITRITGSDLCVRIDDNPEATDLRTLVTRSWFHVGIYGENGFKADAVAIGFDVTDSCLLCRVTTQGVPIEGDRATTTSWRGPHSPNAAPTEDEEITILRRQVADRTMELEQARALHDLWYIGCRWGPFLPEPAIEIDGVVTELADRRCTIRITANPAGSDIATRIRRRPFRIALYGADGYEAEAVATGYDAATATLSCTLMFTKNGAKPAVGDRASTR